MDFERSDLCYLLPDSPFCENYKYIYREREREREKVLREVGIFGHVRSVYSNGCYKYESLCFYFYLQNCHLVLEAILFRRKSHEVVPKDKVQYNTIFLFLLKLSFIFHLSITQNIYIYIT